MTEEEILFWTRRDDERHLLKR